MDDNEKAALLAEIKKFASDVMNPDDSELAKELYPDDEKLYLATVWYLAAKRRYDKAPEPVKTRMDYDEWVAGRTGDPHSQNEWEREIWNAALANALPVQQTDVEPWDEVDIRDAITDELFRAHGGSWEREVTVDELIECIPPFLVKAATVRPAPKTVDLTMEQKFHALIEKLAGGPPPYESVEPLNKAVAEFGRLQDTGKTLDELCREYNVPTTREVV